MSIDGEPVKRRKIKPAPDRNAFFEHILSVAMEDARTKEKKSYHSYKKALVSLRKYPLSMESGRNCRILDGFGVRLCDYLDEKLQDFATTLGLPVGQALTAGNQKYSTKEQSKTPVRAKARAPKRIDRCTVSPVLPVPTTSLVKVTNPSSSADTPPTRVLRIDKSFLQKEALVSPAREQGSPPNDNELSHRLIQQGAVVPHPTLLGKYTLACQSLSASCSRTGLSPSVVQGVCPPGDSSSSSVVGPSKSYPLSFTYVDAHGRTVNGRKLAARRQFPEGTGFRILCDYEPLILSGLRYEIDWTGDCPSASSEMVAYLIDAGAPAVSPRPVGGDQSGLSVSRAHAVQSAPSSPKVISEDRQTQGTSQKSRKTALRRSVTITTVSRSPPVTSSNRSASSDRAAVQPSRAQLTAASRVTASSQLRASSPDGVVSTQSSEGTVEQAEVEESDTPVTVSGGWYDLILLTDIRERFGSDRVKQLLQPILASKGIPCESRALPVGDFLWIARWRTSTGDLKEAVLDYVVERKRADDLASSILDGRFQEQKYRMKRTRVRHPICLIEACPSMRNQRIPYEALLQAVSNAQIIDSFEVMTSAGPTDTVDLLCSLTQRLLLQASHDLIVHTTGQSGVHHHQLHEGDNGDRRLHGIDWLRFVQLAHKTPPPTVRDIFVRQLLQIPGLSGPRAAAIVKVYPTPMSLMLAYDQVETVSGKESLLSKLKVEGGTNRHVSEAAARLLRCFNIKVDHQPTSTLRRKLCRPNLSYSYQDRYEAVYQINCGSCPAVYVGQIKRRLSIRINEHKAAVLRHDGLSLISIHEDEQGHGFELKTVKVLSTARQRQACEFIEAWYSSDHAIN